MRADIVAIALGAVVFASCQNEVPDFFDEDGATSDGPQASGVGGSTTAGSTSGMSSTGGTSASSAATGSPASGSSTVGAASTGVGGMGNAPGTSGGSTDGTGGVSTTGGGQDTGEGGADTSGEGGGGATPGSGGMTGGGETVTVEFEPNSDCAEVTCPERAPYPVACELLFGTETVGQGEQAACIETSLESPVVFMKSGITCQGSQLDEGSITCSSEPPEKPLSTETCVTHNRNPITFVEDRCDCSGSTPGCGFGPGGGIDFVQ